MRLRIKLYLHLVANYYTVYDVPRLVRSRVQQIEAHVARLSHGTEFSNFFWCFLHTSSFLNDREHGTGYAFTLKFKKFITFLCRVLIFMNALPKFSVPFPTCNSEVKPDSLDIDTDEFLPS